ncbi:exported protein [Pusillimonas sp. T7-7]|uniref:COG4315 family predicted lipoprotein n=1 Tax=Pusillimonas sp. (strain T7-7) TaxID=1007105 RepID=UPI0002084366|nr:hypothetical protein [Pusillimonas sp. T7-7]AEC20886.1 exported protein [Pusillimonas sp. T7-7]
MNNFRATALLFSLTCLFTAASYAQAPTQTQNGILVDKAGMTVYTFDKDKANSGKSACNDQCAKAWPPVMADAKSKAEGDYSIIKRDDGAQQWAYKGQPLYTFVKDAKAGDKNGDNVKNVWHVVKP